MSDSKKERVTKADLARRWGCSRQAAGQLLKRNGIKPSDDGRFDIAEVESALNADSGGGMSLAEAIRRKESALAQLRELELEAKAGRVVSVEWVRQSNERLAQSLRAVVLAFPTRTVSEIGGEDGVKRSVYAAAVRLRDALLRNLAGATANAVDLELCPKCTKEILASADKYQFPPEAFSRN